MPPSEAAPCHAGDATSGPEHLSGFEGVSVEDQRRILRDIRLERDRQNRHQQTNASGSITKSNTLSNGKRGRPPGAASDMKSSKPGKQMRISNLFMKK